MKKITFVFNMFIGALLLFTFSCDPMSNFEYAWKNNDSLYVQNYIFNLKDKDVSEIGAICQSILSEKTNFAYGMMLYQKKEGRLYLWDSLSYTEKEIIKYNIVKVWEIYTKSNLFMNKNCKGVLIIDDKEITFQEFFPPDNGNKFSISELDFILEKMNEVEQLCRENKQ